MEMEIEMELEIEDMKEHIFNKYTLAPYRYVSEQTVNKTLEAMKDFALANEAGLKKFVFYVEQLIRAKDDDVVKLCRTKGFHKICYEYLKMQSEEIKYTGNEIDHFVILQSIFCLSFALFGLYHPMFEKQDVLRDYMFACTCRLNTLDFSNPSHILLGRNLVHVISVLVETEKISNTVLSVVLPTLFGLISKSDDQWVILGTLTTLKESIKAYRAEEERDPSYFNDGKVFRYTRFSTDTELLILMILHENKDIAAEAMDVINISIDHEDAIAAVHFMDEGVLNAINKILWGDKVDIFHRAFDLLNKLMSTGKAVLDRISDTTDIPSLIKLFVGNRTNHVRYRTTVEICIQLILGNVILINDSETTREAVEYFDAHLNFDCLLDIIADNITDDNVRLLRYYLFFLRSVCYLLEYFDKGKEVLRHACFAKFEGIDKEYTDTLRDNVMAFTIHRETNEPNTVYVNKIETQECIACEIHGKDTVLLPCAHMICCFACANKLQNDECPMCRQKVENKIQVKLC